MKLAEAWWQVSVVGGDETTLFGKARLPGLRNQRPTTRTAFVFIQQHVRACPECHGLGSRYDFDSREVITDWSKPLLDGGLGPGSASQGLIHSLQVVAAAHGIDLNTPFEKFPEKIQDLLFEWRVGPRQDGLPWNLRNLKQNLEESTSEGYVIGLMDHMSATECPGCRGKRLRPGKPRREGDAMSDRRLYALPIFARARSCAQHQTRGPRRKDWPGASCMK